ncbi:hypothetical protein BG004_007425 [Podila humilis]|nr:hypothetical protein BG004_007425 [Podila humilis]
MSSATFPSAVSDDLGKLYTTIFEQEDASSMHNHINAFFTSFTTPPGSPSFESLPGSPDSAYSCVSSDESSPYLAAITPNTEVNNNFDSESLSTLFNFVMNDELFPRQPDLAFADNTSVLYSDDEQFDAYTLFNSNNDFNVNLVQFNNDNNNNNNNNNSICDPTDLAQQIARHVQRHQPATISQLMTSNSEPYPVSTSSENPTPTTSTNGKSLKARKVRVSRRSKYACNSDHDGHSQSPEPCASAPSSPATAAAHPDSTKVIDQEDGSLMLMDTVTGSTTFVCKLCPNTSFGRIHDYQRHKISIHNAVTYPCEFCEKPFARRDALLRHYNVKSTRSDGTHPRDDEPELLAAARARAKLLK